MLFITLAIMMSISAALVEVLFFATISLLMHKLIDRKTPSKRQGIAACVGIILFEIIVLGVAYMTNTYETSVPDWPIYLALYIISAVLVGYLSMKLVEKIKK
ncbi:MAG: hypothetical protein ABIQ04_03420 [Candidatus Saccharimonadales bacterium]